MLLRGAKSEYSRAGVTSYSREKEGAREFLEVKKDAGRRKGEKKNVLTILKRARD